MFEGSFTALITPFTEEGKIDFARFQDLIEFQIDEGIDGIVPVGTTGESPTLSMEEHMEVIDVAVRVANGRVKVIAGTGANSTAEAIELTMRAKDAGADGTLQVTPYYNKPSQEGLIRHFTAVADLGLPVVLYNVPGRAGKEIDISTIVHLSKHPDIVSVKEAGGSVDRVSKIKSACDIEVLSGDDALTLPMMAVGAVGVISVASNLIPAIVSELVHAAAKGDWEGAKCLHYRYYKLFNDLFIDTNPVPIKAAMEMVHQFPAVYRLPMCEMAGPLRNKLKATLEECGLLDDTPAPVSCEPQGSAE